MALSKYRSKRNFRVTPEPEGEEKPVSKSKAKKKAADPGPLRFVVQLHEASRTHYDLRLEIDGTMKSWAVPKGPSLNPLDRRLAVEVEDHPMEYNNFEGVIPPGNYGAGVVMIWDEGSYTAKSVVFPAQDAADALRRGYKKGHLTFVLEGQKLRGEFALVRLAKGDGHQWLLLKKHDRFAQSSDITHSDRSARSGRTLGEIARESLATGKVWLSRPASPLSTSGADKAEKKGKNTKAPASNRRKPEGGSRNSLAARFKKSLPEQAEPRWSTLESWRPAVKPLDPLLDLRQPYHDGYRAQVFISASGKTELRSKTALPLTKKFPSLIEALSSVQGPLLFDAVIVPLDERDQPRSRGRIQGQSEMNYALYIYDLLHADGFDLRALPLTRRLEILASLVLDQRALRIVSAAKDGEEEKAGRDKSPSLLRAAEAPYGQKAWIGEACVKKPLTQESPRGEATSASHTGPGSVHTVIARKVQSRTRSQLALTNRSKIYWPNEGISKGQLLDYYEWVSPYILPHLKDRPQSLHRQPNGIDAPGFFQKEVSGQVPGWIETAAIVSGRSGQSVNYALCQSKEALLFLANLGCIEINTWLSRVQSINQPDFVVFDLDPGEISFEAVIKVAQTVKGLIEALGAKAFCKSSGSRGLHVYVPVSGAQVFDEARIFAQQLSELVHAQLPDLTSLERSPSRRTKLIYLDFLQNRIGQTMASIYSVRPRPGATVSTPLHWSELKPGFDPRQFTIASLPERLAAFGDLWENIQKEAVPLAELQDALKDLLEPKKAKSPRAKTKRQLIPSKKRR